MKKLIIILLSVIGFTAQAVTPEQIDLANKNTFRIKVDNKGVGTGFLIKNTRYLITNKHVVSHKAKIIEIMDYNGKVYYGQSLHTSYEYDLSLVKIYDNNDTVANHKSDLRFNGGLSLCQDNKVKKGQRIFGIGNPAGFHNYYREGYIATNKTSNPAFKDYDVINYQEYTGKGTSGGAIIREYDNCVIATNFAGFLSYDLGAGIPNKYLLEFLAEYESIKDYDSKRLMKFKMKKEINVLNKQLKKLEDLYNKAADKLNKKKSYFNKGIININNKISKELEAKVKELQKEAGIK